MTVNILSEIRPLRSVITRRPGREIELVTPNNLKKLLFEDIVDLPMIQEEHDIFTNCLRTMGVEVINFDDLIIDVLNNEHGKSLLRNILNIKSDKTMGLFKQTTALEAKEYLITGQLALKDLAILDPALNFIFTRDIGAVIKDHFLFATTFKKIRSREMRIASQTLNFHPRFKEVQGISYPSSFSLEGGDVQVLNEKTILFGASERTMPQAVEAITPQLYQLGFEHIVLVGLEKKRDYMHLDTVFTMINEDECLIFDPAVSKASVSLYEQNKKLVEMQEGFLHALSMFDIHLNPILCGGKDPINQVREQWTDASNALTVKPGCIFIYRRNRHTIEELKQNHYEIISAKDVNSPLSSKGKYAIVLSGNELSRGRGGSHCLTFPLQRT